MNHRCTEMRNCCKVDERISATFFFLVKFKFERERCLMCVNE